MLKNKQNYSKSFRVMQEFVKIYIKIGQDLLLILLLLIVLCLPL